MANFELRVNQEGFRELGVQVEFEENLYGEMLDEFLPETSAPTPDPMVYITPARAWGEGNFRKALLAHEGREEDLPGATYIEGSAQISLRASEDLTETNASLLYGTRRLVADRNGEIDLATSRNHNHRHLRRLSFLGSTGGAAVVGYGIAGPEGLFIGGMLGSAAGMIVSMVDYSSNPIRREWAKFARDPEIIARYGHIVSYRQS